MSVFLQRSASNRRGLKRCSAPPSGSAHKLNPRDRTANGWCMETTKREQGICWLKNYMRKETPAKELMYPFAHYGMIELWFKSNDVMVLF
ncbi:hypothetical protein NDU88_005159 [Pleurodeles waltl]|uniref:Uncharacterized protein n=1 Tax=Pleurodeles waltl TaxID=8319 RepID=A0AAV7PJL6_PLEWA|nr:hypothetical protein NDU88_005159 [Pleurodeles waltl]